MVEGRKQVNLPDDVVAILDDFASRYTPPGAEPLKYPQVIKAMAAQIDPKKYTKRK